MNKLKTSLLKQYLLIIFLAILIIPIAIPGLSALYYLITSYEDPSIQYYNGTELEEMWRETATNLNDADDQQIQHTLAELYSKYEGTTMYWVDENGKTRDTFPKTIAVPEAWTVSDAVAFVQGNRGDKADPFTVVANIGGDSKQGFMVLQTPRSEMVSPSDERQRRYSLVIPIAILVLLILFVLVSVLFFNRIIKRLVRLQAAMEVSEKDGIPKVINVKKMDEIGQLENSFNRMINELEAAKARELEEEKLRRELIANMSHDLRTPLTTIRGHAFRLKQEHISEEGKQSLDVIDDKISYVDKLIDNLLSYTLLSSGRYRYAPEKVDMARLVKSSFAAWYPVFENNQFEIKLNIPEESISWTVDPQWMNRILDNVFQNVLRHAKEGKYIALSVSSQEIIIVDKGPGIKAESSQKGVGIGLSIAKLMVKEMKLKLDIETGEKGTAVAIRNKDSNQWTKQRK
ncbi:sensor histidine kinase [Oceanobacillus piezotolerans]|uniref:histidine kinase n=1 Tax=Oceanobacillus piezotolerans TaxID=2448030 RepID=A0A498D4S8_9BACI|nr:HAMP domain-containing sensor histidine kinase [Oceanobacillus piezotolerans]RLL43603.1 sensor histidine kinase [Oceanobacillus piezotolerans]